MNLQKHQEGLIDTVDSDCISLHNPQTQDSLLGGRRLVIEKLEDSKETYMNQNFERKIENMEPPSNSKYSYQGFDSEEHKQKNMCLMQEIENTKRDKTKSSPNESIT